MMLQTSMLVLQSLWENAQLFPKSFGSKCFISRCTWDLCVCGWLSVRLVCPVNYSHHPWFKIFRCAAKARPSLSFKSSPSSPFQMLRFCVMWLCELEITRSRTPERSHLRSGTGQTPHLNLKPAIKPPVWLPHAHLSEWTSNLERLSVLLLLFMSLRAKMLSLAGLRCFFPFFVTSPESECFAITPKIIFYGLRGNTLTGFLQRGCVYAVRARRRAWAAPNFQFTRSWCTAVLFPRTLETEKRW